MTREVAGLIDQLLALDARLTELVGPEVDSVTDSQGRTMLLRRAQDATRLSELMRQVATLDVLPAQVALLDDSGVLTCVNKAWRQSAATSPLPRPCLVGDQYVQACESGPPALRDAAAGMRAVLQGLAPEFLCEYPMPDDEGERWFSTRVRPVEAGGAVVMHLDITERKRVAAELARVSQETALQERLLGSMLSSTTDLTYAIDRESRLIWANAPTLQVWGTTLEAARGRSALELGYPPAMAQRVHSQLEQVFREGKPVKDEMHFASACYEYVFHPALAPDRSVEFVVGCSRDITARRRSEEAAQESAAEFRTLASAMPQIVWATAPDGELIYLNQRWTEYIGVPLADSLGWGWREVVHPDDRATVDQGLDSSFRQLEQFTLETRLRCADGQYRWWLFRGVPVHDQGRLIKWIGTLTDVDALKNAQHEIGRANMALQQQQSELRALFDVVPAMVWLKDRNGRVLQINHRAASLSGLSVDEACGRSMADLFPDKAEEYASGDEKVFATGKPLLGVVERMQDGDGRTVWVQSDKVPCFAADGSISAVLVMKHDITERKEAQDSLRELNASLEVRVRERTLELAQARDEAERANQAKSTFLATMSHEIRTPMSGMLGLLELLDLSWLDGEQRSTLKVARQSGQALKSIIDGILDFSRIEADSLELDPVPASLPALLATVARLHEPVAHAKNVALTTVVDPAIGGMLRFDPLRLGQILNNFVSNAIKFTERGSVTVQAELLQRLGGREQVRLVVRDTGIGIPPDRLERLFQPFVQAEAATATLYGGTGLGLFIARRLAELMDGVINLDSQPGEGTTLALTVAFDVCAEGSAPERGGEATRQQLNAMVATRRAAPTVEAAQAEGTLLLVVDDHPINCMVLMRQVSTLGYAAESATDGVNALKAWESGRFAAVLTDCNMPRMNGFQLARAIRAAEAARGLQRTPVIGCTANALAEAAAGCIDAGMDDSLTKPVALEDLCARLDRWLPLPPGPSEAGEEPTEPTPLSPGARAANGLLDMALIDTVTGGDRATLVRVLGDLRRSNEEDATELRRAVRREDFEQAGHFAHRIRGACAMLGATLLADASALVQGSAGMRNAPDLHATMQEFEMELLRLNNHLDTLP